MMTIRSPSGSLTSTESSSVTTGDQKEPMTPEIGHRQVHGFCNRYFNKVVLDHFNAVRLIGYGETAVDCYYIYSCPRRGKYWSSAVGGPATLDGLRGQDYVFSNSGEHWDNYTRLDDLLALNGAPEVESFICDLRPNDFETTGAVSDHQSSASTGDEGQRALASGLSTTSTPPLPSLKARETGNE